MSTQQPMAGELDFLPHEKVIYGPGVVAGRLREQVERLGGQRAFVVASNTLVSSSDWLERVKKALGEHYVGVYTDTKAHTPRRCVLEAAAQAREAGADVLISLGGGSHIDCVKGVALVLAEGEDFAGHRIRFEYPNRRVVPPLPHAKLPHIAIPTTLSGGEFTAVIGITDEETGHKDIFQDPKLTPRVVIMDPELTRATNAYLWLTTGVNGLDRSISRVCSLYHNPFTDALALHAVSLFVKALPQTKEDPENVATRGQLQLATLLSMYGGRGAADINSAVRHQMGPRCGVSHGEGSCVLAPRGMAFNRPYAASRQALCARAMGIATEGMMEEAAATAAAEALSQLIAGLGLPQRLRDVGVKREDLPTLAEDAFHDPFIRSNPRPLKGVEEVLAFLQEAW